MSTPTAPQIHQTLARLSKPELERALELARALARKQPWRPLPGPQLQAYTSLADITGYGGAAGGGKTDLLAGLSLCEHERVAIFRKEKAQTEGIIQRLTEIVGTTDGFNSTKAIWRVPVGKSPLIEFGGLDNPGDERRWQGRAHDLKAYDEVTEMREDQVRYTMGWRRTGKAGLRARILMTFNPPQSSEGMWVVDFFAPWLREGHPNPAEPGELRWFTTINGKDFEVPDNRPFVLIEDARVYDFDPLDYTPEEIIEPLSRTFIPARVTDNPYYMASGYMRTLQALPEPLRSQLMYGDFKAGIKDGAMQVIPTEWVALAMARWKMPERLAPMDSLGVDVARGGNDDTVIARRHGDWYDKPIVEPGKGTPDGPSTAALAVQHKRDEAPIHIDAIGVGSSPFDFLKSWGQQVIGVIASEAGHGADQSGRFGFANVKSMLWWRMREALDPANNRGTALYPDDRLKRELTLPTWKVVGSKIQVESRDDIIKRAGRSIDYASAYLLASIETPKLPVELRKAAQRDVARGHDPYQAVAPAAPASLDYNPYA